MEAFEISRAQNAMTVWLDDNWSHLISTAKLAPPTWPPNQPFATMGTKLGELVYCSVAIDVGFFFHKEFADLQRAFYTRDTKALW
jgi:hypothetical protein